MPTKRFAGIWYEILQGSGGEREAKDGKMRKVEMRERERKMRGRRKENDKNNI
jgi:hypothetical protein